MSDTYEVRVAGGKVIIAVSGESIVVMDHDEYDAHRGVVFHSHEVIQLAASGHRYFGFWPSQNIANYLTIAAWSSQECEVKVYRSVNPITSGTAMDFYNSNDNFSDNCEGVLKNSVSFPSGLVEVKRKVFGGGREAQFLPMTEERVLKKELYYGVEFVNRTNQASTLNSLFRLAEHN